MSAAASLLPPALLGLSTDYYVLQHFYELMDGANWKNNENWLDGEPCYNEWASSSQYDCYTGDLVRTPQPICCEASVDEARAVVKLDLYGNNLAGTIPEEMANLDQLRLLVLDGNGISGTIPKSLGKMRYLEVLWLQDNSLSGTIPTTLKTYITGDPGSIILRPNRFNCSELDAIENAWCNSSLADLFDAGVTPDGLSSGAPLTQNPPSPRPLARSCLPLPLHAPSPSLSRSPTILTAQRPRPTPHPRQDATTTRAASTTPPWTATSTTRTRDRSSRTSTRARSRRSSRTRTRRCCTSS